jgi:hypothetical protein
MPAVEEMVTRRPDRCFRMIGNTARATFIGPNSSVSICFRTRKQVVVFTDSSLDLDGLSTQLTPG